MKIKLKYKSYIILALTSISFIFGASPTFTAQMQNRITSRAAAYCTDSASKMSVVKISKPCRLNFVEEFMGNLEGATSLLKNRVYTKNGQLVMSDVSDVCFRGQRDAQRPLISALDRLNPTVHKDKTTTLLSQFIPHDEVLYTKDPVSQLSYLQHNGVSTPLLDWTKKPSTALYYAVSKYMKQNNLAHKDTAALFVLDPYSLNEKYRISKNFGVKVGGIALSDNFDAVIRARHPLTHSHFELSCDPHVKKAAESSGLKMTPQEELCISCLRTGAKIEKNDIRRALSGPIAVIPKWTSDNERVRALNSLFTLDGIFDEKSDAHYPDYILKIEFDSLCVEKIIEHYRNSDEWNLIEGLATSTQDKSFKKLQDEFNHMMSGGFR